jgi:hypothetical protein
MNEINPILLPSLDAALNQFYSGSQPDSAFAARLEAQLRQRQNEMLSARSKSAFSFSNTKESFMQTLRARPLLAVIAAILALLLLTGIAYAVGRLIIDPGLQSVQDAGLVTDLGATAQPTLLPTKQAMIVPATALTLDQSETVEGVTLTLDWVYLDETRLLYGVQFSDLPDNVTVGFPTMFVNGLLLGGDQQQSKSLRMFGTRAIYLSNQVLQSSVVGENVALELAIPLLRSEGGKETQAAVFHFSLENVPLNTGQTLGFQQTAAASVNGIELDLHSVRLTPAAIEAVVCPSPISSAVFSFQQAALSGDRISERQFISVQPVENRVPSCQKASFDPQGLEGSKSLTLTVNKNWKFYIDLPGEDQIPGIKPVVPLPTPQPVASLAIDKVTMTLDWAFVDAKRIAFGYTISGLPELPEAASLGGTIAVNDAQGVSYPGGNGGHSTLQRVQGQPGTLSGTWSSVLREPLTQDQISFGIDFTLDGSHGQDWNFIITAYVPYNGYTPEPGALGLTVIPDHLVGTYHFDVTTKVYPLTTQQPGQVIEANGIEMELVQAELTPSYSSFILCYNKPSAADWMISSKATLFSGVEQAPIEGYTMLRDRNFQAKNPTSLPLTKIDGENVRCVKVSFMLGHSNQARTLTLTVPALERSMPEVLPQAELDAAYARLKEQGIEMNYNVSWGVGGGGSGLQYTKKPAGMTDEEAYARFVAALGYLTPGPWVFTFPFQP